MSGMLTEMNATVNSPYPCFKNHDNQGGAQQRNNNVA